MGIDIPIVIHTHSDYEDVQKILFGQLKKYLPNQKVYVLINKRLKSIPSEYDVLVYDESLVYTDRIKMCLSQIKEKVILFQHEDMILFNKPNGELIKKYTKMVENGDIDSVKMIYVMDSNESTFSGDNTLVSNQYSKFSIQPTIVSVDKMLELFNSTEPLNIWDFELAVPAEGKHYMVRLGGEQKRGIYHYDSLIYPYIATAIIKGKWNYGEYPNELDTLFNEYGIIPFERGIA